MFATNASHASASTPSSQPSLGRANALYLTSLLLVVVLGNLLQTSSIGWGLLATEFGLILLPCLVWLRLDGLPLRETLSLRWPGVGAVLLSALIGAGAWVAATLLDALGVVLVGYSPYSPFAALPPDPFNLAVFVVGLAVAAPLCEEALFRGYLLRAYRNSGGRYALVAVSLLFAFFHLRLQGLLGLLPIAFALTFLAQRSHSLVPAIVAHAINNSLSAGLAVLTILYPGRLASDATWMAVLGGGMLLALPAGGVALWLFRRITPASATWGTRPPAPRRAYGPLAGAAAVYLAFAGLEFVQGRYPQMLVEPDLTLKPAPWSEPLTLSYDLENVLDEQVGTAVCALTPEKTRVAFACTIQQRSFEAYLGNSMYAGGNYVLNWHGHWRADSLQLLDAEYTFDGEYGDSRASILTEAGGLAYGLDGAAPRTMDGEAVVDVEWPLRMMALDFERPWSGGHSLMLLRLRPGEGAGGVEPMPLLIVGREYAPVADGHVLSWKVRLGRETAWYRVDEPHTLVRYDDGFGVIWVPTTTPRNEADPSGT